MSRGRLWLAPATALCRRSHRRGQKQGSGSRTGGACCPADLLTGPGEPRTSIAAQRLRGRGAERLPQNLRVARATPPAQRAQHPKSAGCGGQTPPQNIRISSGAVADCSADGRSPQPSAASSAWMGGVLFTSASQRRSFIPERPAPTAQARRHARAAVYSIADAVDRRRRLAQRRA